MATLHSLGRKCLIGPTNLKVDEKVWKMKVLIGAQGPVYNNDNIRAVCDLIEGERRLVIDEIAAAEYQPWEGSYRYHRGSCLQKGLCGFDEG